MKTNKSIDMRYKEELRKAAAIHLLKGELNIAIKLHQMIQTRLSYNMKGLIFREKQYA